MKFYGWGRETAKECGGFSAHAMARLRCGVETVLFMRSRELEGTVSMWGVRNRTPID